jgi:hypothetical protein
MPALVTLTAPLPPKLVIWYRVDSIASGSKCAILPSKRSLHFPAIKKQAAAATQVILFAKIMTF